MARYTGPKHKLARREGINILDKDSASLQRRLNIPPGVHGRKLKRRPSEFAIQLREKQKAKAMYGIFEKQFKKMVQSVEKKKGDTTDLIVAILESRLDNVVYRLGFAKSRPMARQLVSHGHVFVNGRKVNIPSYQVKAEDTISLESSFVQNPGVVESIKNSKELLPHLKRENTQGKFLRVPKKEDVQLPFDLRLIIEYYSR